MSGLFRYILALCVTLAISLMVEHEAKAQQVGVKTNALMWACATPNLGCEIVVGEKYSLDLSAFGHYNPYGIKSEVIAFQPELRYWFSGRPMTREYIGVSAMVANYDMMINSREVGGKYVYDGNAASLGITGGYAFVLSKNWRFELCGGFSVLVFKQKQYYETDDYYVDSNIPANSTGYKLFPAKLGVSFTYIIK